MYNKVFLQKLFLVGIAFYIINFSGLYFFDKSLLNSNFHGMHLFYLILNGIAMIVISEIFKKNKDIVGMSFLLISTVETIVVFLFGKFIFDVEISTVKWNYFILFIAYLFTITFLTGQKLNQTKF
jgi:hypothetical protein